MKSWLVQLLLLPGGGVVEVKPLKLTADDCCLSGDTLANVFGDHRASTFTWTD